MRRLPRQPLAAVGLLPILSGLTPSGVVVWAALAFALWILLLAALRRLHLGRLGVVAALLSWLAAGAVIWSLPLLLHWLGPVLAGWHESPWWH